ncbi:hypothetical protein LguiB_017148 [Lonicera macranthoides]
MGLKGHKPNQAYALCDIMDLGEDVALGYSEAEPGGRPTPRKNSDSASGDIHIGSIMVKLIYSNLLHNFDWEPPDGMKKDDIDTTHMPAMVVQKKTPLCLAARKT